MRTLEGQFSHLLEPSALIQGWHFRYAHEIAPAAELTTDGKTFRMAYSETWDVQSLRNSFVIGVDPKIETGE